MLFIIYSFKNIDKRVYETTNNKTSLNKIKYNDMSIKLLISLKKLSYGQIQDVLLLNNWEFESTKEHRGILKYKRTNYKSSDSNSELGINDSNGEKMLYFSTKNKELNKYLITELYSNNYRITGDVSSAVNINDPKVGEYYQSENSGKVYSNGVQQIYYRIIVYKKVIKVLNDKKGTYYVDDNSKYTSYGFSL